MLNTESKDAAVIHTVDCAKCIPGLRDNVNRRTHMIIIQPLTKHACHTRMLHHEDRGRLGRISHQDLNIVLV